MFTRIRQAWCLFRHDHKPEERVGVFAGIPYTGVVARVKSDRYRCKRCSHVREEPRSEAEGKKPQG